MSSADGIRIAAFRELWVHTGTACNLSCEFCHEAAAPADTRLTPPTFDELAPQLDAAAAAGVERFAFTGGEPLIHRDIVRILRHALALRPVLVLTNGTAPLLRRPHSLAQLQGLAHAATFRVSIDHPDETLHDAARGYRNFRKALQGLKILVDAGFDAGITRLCLPGEDVADMTQRFRLLLRRHGLPDTLPVVGLPDLGRPGRAAPARPAMATGAETACCRSRLLFRRGSTLAYGPCPLVDDDPGLDLGHSLREALAATVIPRHARCATCLETGVNYAG
ncbi:MAG: hypothetical protein RLZZ393_1032 [Pseudomonadota bacterium]|jgi:molybdenum cofactor biosynthesis enzyme MoaA